MGAANVLVTAPDIPPANKSMMKDIMGIMGLWMLLLLLLLLLLTFEFDGDMVN